MRDRVDGEQLDGSEGRMPQLAESLSLVRFIHKHFDPANPFHRDEHQVVCCCWHWHEQHQVALQSGISQYCENRNKGKPSNPPGMQLLLVYLIYSNRLNYANRKSAAYVQWLLSKLMALKVGCSAIIYHLLMAKLDTFKLISHHVTEPISFMGGQKKLSVLTFWYSSAAITQDVGALFIVYGYF
jgi:hypothetical protein